MWVGLRIWFGIFYTLIFLVSANEDSMIDFSYEENQVISLNYKVLGLELGIDE